jgi:Tol biopolymer transport system component
MRAAADEYILGRPEIVNGQVVLFTRLPRKEFGLPDAETKAQIVAQSIRTGERRVLATGGSDARYLPTGHVVYAVGGALHAVRFDPARLAVVGGGAPVLEGVRRAPNATLLTAQYSVSASGSLIYLPGPSGTADQIALQRGVLAEVDRSGQTNVKFAPRAFALEQPRYSPDGRQVAFEMVREPAAMVARLSRDRQPSQIGIYDLSGAAAVRPLVSPGSNRWPIWSPDGRRVTFTSFSAREHDSGLFWQLADGTGPAERLTRPEPGTWHVPNAWSSNGRTLLFEAGNSTLPWTLWTLSLPDRKIERFGPLESGHTINATFAPNGRWVAYGIGEGPESRIYVEPFPRTGDQHVVTTNGPAWSPFWSPDGNELFYASGLDSFHAVGFSTQPTVTFGNPFPVPRGRLFGGIGGPRPYDLSPDGQRILGVIVAQTTQQAIAPTIQVVVNWAEELKAKVP